MNNFIHLTKRDLSEIKADVIVYLKKSNLNSIDAIEQGVSEHFLALKSKKSNSKYLIVLKEGLDDLNYEDECYISSLYLEILYLVKDLNAKSLALEAIANNKTNYGSWNDYQLLINTFDENLTEDDNIFIYISPPKGTFHSQNQTKKLISFITSRLEPKHPRESDPFVMSVMTTSSLHDSINPHNRLARLANVNEIIQKNLESTFSHYLFALIDERKLKDTEVYKKAGITKQVFSKIRNPLYQPTFETAIRICLALELNLDDTKDLLGKAGFSLSHSKARDLVIEYCIENKIYDIYDVNAYLLENNFGEI